MVLGFVSVQTQASGPHHCYTHGTGVGQLLCYMQGLLKQENSNVQVTGHSFLSLDFSGNIAQVQVSASSVLTTTGHIHRHFVQGKG